MVVVHFFQWINIEFLVDNNHQSVLGIVIKNQSHNKDHINPRPLKIKSPKLELYFVLKVKPEVISKRLIEIETGKNNSPKPIGPPDDFSTLNVFCRKKTFIKMISVDIVQLAAFNFLKFCFCQC
jgi:hypothetical protein